MLDLASLNQPLEAALAGPTCERLPEQATSCGKRSPWWREEWLGAPGEPSTSSVESLALGHSVIVVPDFVSTSECDQLIAMATELAQHPPPQLTGDNPALTAGRLRLPAVDWPGAAARALSDALVRRALAFAREQLPLLGLGEEEEEALVFSEGEPAVNVYTAGGQVERLPLQPGTCP